MTNGHNASGKRKRGLRLEGRDPTLSSSRNLRNRSIYSICDHKDNITHACVKSIDKFIKWFGEATEEMFSADE